MSLGPLHAVQLLNPINHELVKPLLVGGLRLDKHVRNPQQASACRTSSNWATAARMSRTFPGFVLMRTSALMLTFQVLTCLALGGSQAKRLGSRMVDPRS